MMLVLFVFIIFISNLSYVDDYNIAPGSVVNFKRFDQSLNIDVGLGTGGIEYLVGPCGYLIV